MEVGGGDPWGYHGGDANQVRGRKWYRISRLVPCKDEGYANADSEGLQEVESLPEVLLYTLFLVTFSSMVICHDVSCRFLRSSGTSQKRCTGSLHQVGK